MNKVIIFGQGNFFQNMKTNIHNRYHIVAFLDNKIKLGQEEYLQDLKVYVYNPGELKKLPNCPVIIMVKKFWELYEQLLSLGIEENRILFGIELFPVTEKEKLIFSGKEHLVSSNGGLIFKTPDGDVALCNQEEYDVLLEKYADKKRKEKYPYIELIANMPTVPESRKFGTEWGKPIDRYYIEKFLNDNKLYIRGETLEIAETTYSLKYGEGRIRHAHMLHVEGWGENAIKGNLETGEGIKENRYDSLIITQTLMFTYDLNGVAQNVYRALKHGGTALITVSGISQISRYDADNWGSYYSFYKDTFYRLFIPLFGEKNVRIESYGNVKTAIAMLYGLCCEDLAESDFRVYDADYPVIIGAVLQKQ